MKSVICKVVAILPQRVKPINPLFSCLFSITKPAVGVNKAPFIYCFMKGISV